MQPMVEMRLDEWTIEGVEALDVPDWWRYELVDGGLSVSPPAGGTHELVSEELRAIVRSYLSADMKIVGPIGVAVDRGTYFVPDLAVCARSALPGVNHLLPSDVSLVVEVVSPGSKSMDRVLKPSKYAAAGIRAYWRVELDPVSLTAYVLRDGAYAEVGTWVPGDVAELAEPFQVTITLADLVP